MAQTSPSHQTWVSDQTNSALLSLPTELRLQIWEYVFPSGEYIPMRRKHNKDLCRNDVFVLRHTEARDRIYWRRHHMALWRHGYLYAGVTRRPDGMFRHGDPSILLSLALTCRTMCEEVLPLLYSSLIFGFFDEESLMSFFEHVLPSNIRHIRHIVVNLHGGYSDSPRWVTSCDTLLNLPKLNTLDFDYTEQPREIPGIYEDSAAEYMQQIVDSLAPFKGKSVRGKWNFWVRKWSEEAEAYRDIFEKAGLQLVVKAASFYIPPSATYTPPL